MASSNGPYESDMENEERTRWDRARNSYRADDPQLSLEDDDDDADEIDYCSVCGEPLFEDAEYGTCEDCLDSIEEDLEDDEDEPDDDTEEEDEDDDA